MKKPSNSFTCRNCRGFTLMEIMVSFIVLSVGFLGLAALHANGLRNNQSAYWRSQATILAYGICDSMRVNRDAALGENFDLAIGSAPSGNTIVVNDLINWKAGLAAALPIGDGSIDCNPATAICTVIVQWDDSMGEGGSNNQQFEVRTQL